MQDTLITGAGGGLGLELVKEHVRRGWTVFALSHHRSEKLEKIKEEAGGRLKIILCDVGDTDSVNHAAEEVRKDTGRLDRLFNNAGIDRASQWTTLEQTDIDFMLEEYNVNAVGAIRVIKACLPLISENTFLVNISSEAGGIQEQKADGGYGYCMSKAALNMGTKLLSNWLGRKGVRALALHPGRMRTGMGGPDSEIDPWETAQEMMRLLERAEDLPKGQLFFDYLGRPMSW